MAALIRSDDKVLVDKQGVGKAEPQYGRCTMAYLPVIARVSASRIGLRPCYGSLRNLQSSCWQRPVARRPIGLSSGSLATVTLYGSRGDRVPPGRASPCGHSLLEGSRPPIGCCDAGERLGQPRFELTFHVSRLIAWARCGSQGKACDITLSIFKLTLEYAKGSSRIMFIEILNRRSFEQMTDIIN
jgi:hypothetical protein